MPIIIQEKVITKGIISQEELVVPFRVGIDGVTFTPSVSVDGVISWTNDGGLDNPAPINIKGQTGDNVEFRTNGGYVQWKPTTGSTWTNLIAIADLAQLSGTTGQSTTIGMTQKAITDNLALKVNTSAVKQVTGTSTTDLMSQKAVTDELANKIDKSSITPDFGSDATKVISQKGYTDDMKAWIPSSVYSDRVTADSGSIRNRALLFDSYKSILDLSANTLLQYSPEMGLKQNVSGVVYKASKLYDMSSNNNDAAQATAGSQPYIVNNIAPNERAGLWGLSKTLPFTAITLSTTDKWSIVLVSEQLGGASDFIGSTNTRVTTTSAVNDSITFKNESGTSVSLNITKLIGKPNRIALVAKGDGTLQVWVNGLLQGIISNPTNITLNSLYFNTNSKVKAVRVLNKDLSKSEIENIDNFLKIAYPDIDGTAIGSQYWATSNAMISVTGDGTTIPEVTDNAVWATAQSLYDAAIAGGQTILQATKAAAMFCKYNNSDDNAAVYGYLYNWWAVYLIWLNPPKGWRVPSLNDYEQMISYLGGILVAGGKLKIGGTQYWAAPNTGANNSSGFSSLGAGRRGTDGGFLFINVTSFIWLSSNISNTTASFGRVGNNTAETVQSGTESKMFGFSLRLIRNAPVGEQFEEVTSGVFSTNIATAQKELSVKLGYTIESVKVSSANALTNFKVEMRSASGALLQTLMTGKNVPSGNIPTEFKCLVDMPIQLQDYKLWVTAVGNEGDGMEIKVMTKKILF